MMYWQGWWTGDAETLKEYHEEIPIEIQSFFETPCIILYIIYYLGESKVLLSQSPGAVEYTDCTSVEG